MGCMLLDIDSFKQINDTLGHETGDRVLEDAAAILTLSAGTADTAARFGGDEFALIFPNCSPQKLQRTEDRIHELTDAYNRSLRRPYTLAFSIGSGLYDPSADIRPGEFISRIDEAMYTAKRKKRSSAELPAEQAAQTV